MWKRIILWQRVVAPTLWAFKKEIQATAEAWNHYGRSGYNSERHSQNAMKIELSKFQNFGKTATYNFVSVRLCVCASVRLCVCASAKHAREEKGRISQLTFVNGGYEIFLI